MSSKAKIIVCKELDCADPAQVNGFCRLHFLKLVKKPSKEEEAQERQANRRRSNRLAGLGKGESEISEEMAEDRVQAYGEVETSDLTSFLDGDDIGALPDSPPARKKTGS